MSRLDCGPSLHNYTAAPSGAHLVFHQRAIAILLPSATGTGKSAREAHALVNTNKNVKVLHKSLARGLTTCKNDGHDYRPGAPDGKPSEIFWIRLTRPSGKETAGKCSEKAKLGRCSHKHRLSFASERDHGICFG